RLLHRRPYSPPVILCLPTLTFSVTLQPSSSKVQTPPSPPTNAGAKHHRRGSKVTVASGSKVAVPR
ncbi:hypothetical protein S83_026507, partial [Arachis hypogaea]